KSRLHIIETLDQLGAGFTLASHDMDLRGAGNLLGEEQSGHIKEVGIDLYQQMLEEAVQAAKDATAEAEAQWSPQINLGIPVLIPEGYVADLGVRLGLYRRIADLRDQGEIEGFAAELIDRFGPLPPEVENLIAVVTIKRLCRDAGIDRLDAGPKGAVLSFRNNKPPKVDRLMQFIARQAGSVKLRPTDQKLVYIRVWDDAEVRMQGVKHLMQDLALLAA
ncbi:MAG TPA: TRCF domain-containing protein, partial [Alphaproteobacteria bacterium]|nr:TRCF domain-containing protein [Alphaproteobacteria bacterium]